MSLLEPQTGEICPVCIEKGRNGVMELRSGKYGKFLGCTQYPKCVHTEPVSLNLENLATQLLKVKKKKTRRGEKRKKERRAKKQQLINRQKNNELQNSLSPFPPRQKL